MQESETICPEPVAPSRWLIVPAVVAGALTLWIFYVADFIFPGFWEWQPSGVVAIFLMGAATGWIAPRGRQWLTYGVLAAVLGLLTIIRGSPWFYYSLSFVPVALAVRCGVAAAGYAAGLFLRRFQVGRWAMLAVLCGLAITEVTWILARDGYVLLRHARPRHIAFNDTDASWLFLSPGERARGLTYIALQRKGIEARRMFVKALHAASEVSTDGHIVLAMIAQGQVKAGFFPEAEATVRCIQDPVQFNLYFTILATEMAKHGGQAHARRLFDEAIQKAKQHPEQHQRDRDLYLIGHRQWEGGMHSEARQTAALIQTADSKADLLDRLNDSWQLEVARQQAGSNRFSDAEATIKQHVKDPYRYCDGLISVASTAATNAQPDHARRIFEHARTSAQQIESPSGSNGVMADIALRQLELGFQRESQQTVAFITHPGIKAELLKKLARAEPYR